MIAKTITLFTSGNYLDNWVYCLSFFLPAEGIYLFLVGSTMVGQKSWNMIQGYALSITFTLKNRFYVKNIYKNFLCQ